MHSELRSALSLLCHAATPSEVNGRMGGQKRWMAPLAFGNSFKTFKINDSGMNRRLKPYRDTSLNTCPRQNGIARGRSSASTSPRPGEGATLPEAPGGLLSA